jgi:UDP-N-acetyl-2-amino-2-deoxyglucuronate dehydrogenase
MNQTLNVAIVGCGRVAGHHVRAVVNHPQLRLTAVADLKPERMTGLGAAADVARFTNYHEMLRSHPEIQVVTVITPSGMHGEHALDVIRTYGKHVIIEKPVVMRLSQGAELAHAARAAGVQVFPVHQYRFNRCVQRILRAVRERELGDIALATVRQRWCRTQQYYDRDPWRGTFALDGGCCTNQGIHHLDMLRYLAGEVRRVNATMRTFNADIEVEDTATALLEFESGALGALEITTAARPRDYESSLSIVGTGGTAMLGGWATDKLMVFSPKPEDEAAYSDSFADAYGFGHNDIYAGVHTAIVMGGRPAVEFEDAMKTVALLHAVYASAERGGWVEVAAQPESERLGRPDDALASIYRTAPPDGRRK